jgi:lipoic acid synthetase
VLLEAFERKVMNNLIQIDKKQKRRKPEWLKVRMPAGKNFQEVYNLSKEHGLATVCQEAHCPNIGECWNDRTATFMMFGDTCTRSCGFCAVKTGRPKEVDPTEPDRIIESIKHLSLKHAVVTSVNLDHLKMGGSEIWADLIEKVHKETPNCTIEVLTPDFRGRNEAIDTVLDAKPDIFSHNIETVKRLQKTMRPQAKYQRSLDVLHRSAETGLITKTGIMIGAGETTEEILETMKDIKETGAHIIYIGQYLSPSKNHIPVDKYYTPEEFDKLKMEAERMGFWYVESSPLVRSSYHAEKSLKIIERKRKNEKNN